MTDEVKAPTTTEEWTSTDNPHNVDSFAAYKDEISNLTGGIEDFIRKVPKEIATQFKADLQAVIDKIESL